MKKIGLEGGGKFIEGLSCKVVLYDCSMFAHRLDLILKTKAWSPYSCNGRKHRCKHVSESVPSGSDTREHFDYNIASLTCIVINCSVSSSFNDRSNR